MKAVATQAWITPSTLHLTIVLENAPGSWRQIVRCSVPLGEVEDLRPPVLEALEDFAAGQDALPGLD